MTHAPKIEARDNAFLLAKGISSMTGEDGKAIETRPAMGLCRCGASQNKPFCDGSHKDAGFDSSKGKPEGRDRLIPYEGEEVSVYYNPMLCSHAAECGRRAGHIFNPEQQPWVQPDNGTRAEVEAVVAACPSGALTLRKEDGTPEHLFEPNAQIAVQKDGPLWVQNVEPPEDPTGEGQTRDKYVLCRCGLSGNKPFCDGSHRDAGWKSGN